MRKMTILLVLFCLAGIQASFAQKAIAGKVTGKDDGKPLPGTTVVITGTLVSAVTDEAGNFSISVPAGAVKLNISHTGMKTLEVLIANQTNFNIVLETDVKSLGEVVVVGYGTQKKSDLTGAVSSVKGKDIDMLATKRVDQALQGRVAGVTVQNTDGAPGGNTVIRIRGSNSVLGGNNALVVIDGLQGGDLNKLNPSDVESVEVLKDASATAIYGSRGANGVLLVTTKRGKTGKPVINYSGSAGVQRISHKLDLLSSGDYARNINAVRMLDNNINTPVPIFTDAQIAAFDKNGGTDWQAAIYQQAFMQNHQLSISGGTEDVKYYVSGGYLDQNGILINSGYKRYSFRTNLNATINKWLNGGVNIASVKDDGKSPAFGGESGENLILQGAVIVAPRWGAVNPIYNPDGTYFKHPANFGPADTWNPVASAKEVDPSVKSVNNTVKAYFDIKFFEGLTLEVSGFANVVNGKESKFYNEKTKQGLPVDGKGGLGYLYNSQYEYYQDAANLTYDKTFKVHHLTVMAVAEQSTGQANSSSLTASRFTATQNGLNDLSSAGLVINTSTANKRTLRSYLGRVNYALMDKYLLTVSYRADASSVFGENNKWGYFPSASVAWKLSEEKFIKNIHSISQLKLRASAGTTGNQGIDPYQSLASITSNQNYPYNGGTSTNNGFGLTNPANPNLKWESTMQVNLGLDLEMFKGRLNATVDVYQKKTTNLLLYRQLPLSSGFTNIIDNLGSTQNKGLEIAVGGTPLAGSLKWTTGFNITFNRSKVISLGEDQTIPYITSSGGYGLDKPLMNLVVGQPFGQMYGWGYEGTWGTKDAAQAKTYGQLPGDPHYTDLNKDGVIDINDIKVIGNALPKFVYGWNNRFSYQRFDLSILIQGVYGNNIFNQTRIRLESPSEANSKNILNRWTETNQNTNVPAYIDGKTRATANLTSQIYDVDGRVGRWVEDGTYMRLKNITLGYNAPAALISRLAIKDLRAYISATNLFTITKYSGYDPEVSSYNLSDAQRGVDFGNYPSSRIFTFGFDISF
jgi:TonB-linked SusC/RagA family outer membrane protein